MFLAVCGPVHDGEETTGKVGFTRVRIITVEEDIIGGLVVRGDIAAELDLRLKDGAGHVLGFDGGGVEVEAEGGGCVGN